MVRTSAQRPTAWSAGGTRSLPRPAAKPTTSPKPGPLARASETTASSTRSGVAPGNPSGASKATCTARANTTNSTANAMRPAGTSVALLRLRGHRDGDGWLRCACGTRRQHGVAGIGSRWLDHHTYEIKCGEVDVRSDARRARLGAGGATHRDDITDGDAGYVGPVTLGAKADESVARTHGRLPVEQPEVERPVVARSLTRGEANLHGAFDSHAHRRVGV